MIIALATSARAGSGNTTAAERLFREGQELLRAGNYTEACDKLKRSNDEDRQLGTLLNLAFCHEKEALLKHDAPARAWIEYRDAEALAASVGNKDREAFARKHRAELEKDLASCQVSGSGLVEVRVDGDAIARAENGEVIYVAPGMRKFAFVFARNRIIEQSVSVLRTTAPATIKAPASPDEPARPSPPLVDKAPPPTTWSSTPWPWVAFGVGAAGIAAGSVIGLRALDQIHARNQANDDKRPPDEVNALDSKATVTANISTTCFIVGGVGVVLGIVLLAIPGGAPAPDGSARVSRLSVSFTSSGARLSGAF